MLVDNAIVVMENVTRLRRLGLPPQKAAADGAGEVTAALVSSTLTTVIVFLPMVFVSGVAGQLFKELAFTVIVSLAASLAVALTVIPSLAATLPMGDKVQPDVMAAAGRSYENVLTAILKRGSAAGIAQVAIVLVLSLFVFGFLDREFMPGVDRGQFAIEYSLAPGTALNRTESVAAALESFLLQDPSVKSVIASGGSEDDRNSGNAMSTLGQHQGCLLVNLKPRRPWWALIDFTGAWRHVSSRQLAARTRDFADDRNFAGAEFKFVVSDNVFQGAFASEAPIAVQIKGYDLDYMADLTRRLEHELESVRGISEIRNSLIQASPENRIVIDKDKAAVMGLSVSDIALLTQTAVDGKTAGTWKHEGREHDIRVRLRPEDRDDLDAIRRLTMRSPAGYEVMLADVARIEPGRGPTEIRHEDQQRTVTVWADSEGKSPYRIAKLIESRILPRLNLRPDYSVTVEGEAVAMRDSLGGLMFALILSLVLVYMVMAGQFEHFVQPVIIMGTIPLALIGVIGGLVLTGTRVSIMTSLGMIVLGGIVVNNGIVLIDYINRLRAEGLSLLPAVVEAGRTRLQPIVMTAATTILGLLPLAAGIGDGAGLQRPMAITVIAGLLTSTFLSLAVVPVLYFMVAGKSEARHLKK
jgi:HAE1 family hydrophobic/amphiphilic exporter-1